MHLLQKKKPCRLFALGRKRGKQSVTWWHEINWSAAHNRHSAFFALTRVRCWIFDDVAMICARVRQGDTIMMMSEKWCKHFFWRGRGIGRYWCFMQSQQLMLHHGKSASPVKKNRKWNFGIKQRKKNYNVLGLATWRFFPKQDDKEKKNNTTGATVGWHEVRKDRLNY